MNWYIIYFDSDNKVIDVVQYAENDDEYNLYLTHVQKALAGKKNIQYGYW